MERSMSRSDEARLVFRHLDEEDWIEVKAQMHGDERVSIWEKYLEWTPNFLSLYARYDPHMITERHGHLSDHIVFVLEGEITVGDTLCTQGMHITLEKGAVFGPIIAGDKGALLYEIMMGDPRAVPADKEGFLKLCAERGVEPLPNPPVKFPDWVGARTD
jgi:quercetin dioxygenase-like cupin family protein